MASPKGGPADILIQKTSIGTLARQNVHFPKPINVFSFMISGFGDMVNPYFDHLKHPCRVPVPRRALYNYSAIL